jgi:hypothetical protein
VLEALRHEDVSGSGRTVPCTHNLGTRLLHASAALPPDKGSTVAIGEEAECSPEPVWTRWLREEQNFTRGACGQ